MRFVDSNVFIHAFLRPRRRLERHETEIKEAAKQIVLRLEDGEEASTTVVHLSEVANLLEARMPLGDSRALLSSLVTLRGLRVVDVGGVDYSAAIQASGDLGVGVNDCLAYLVMREHGIGEIYSFDRHFDEMDGISRIAS